MEQDLYARAPQPPRPAGRGRSIGAGFMYFGFYLVVNSAVSTLYVLALAIVSVLKAGTLDIGAFIAQVTAGSVLLSGITNILTLVVYWIFFSRRRCRFGEETGLRPVSLPALLIVVPLGFTAYIFVACVLSLLPEAWLSSYAQSAEALLGGSGPLVLLCIVVLAPLAEEVIFRGLLYSRLKRGMGKPLALLLASLLFGVMHGHPVWMAYAFCLSLLLCSLFDWYGSLWASVLMHLCFNAGEYLLAPLLESLDPLTALAGSALLLVPLILLANRLGLGARERRLT